MTRTCNEHLSSNELQLYKMTSNESQGDTQTFCKAAEATNPR